MAMEMNEDKQILTSTGYFFRNCYNTASQPLFAFWQKLKHRKRSEKNTTKKRESLCRSHWKLCTQAGYKQDILGKWIRMQAQLSQVEYKTREIAHLNKTTTEFDGWLIGLTVCGSHLWFSSPVTDWLTGSFCYLWGQSQIYIHTHIHTSHTYAYTLCVQSFTVSLSTVDLEVSIIQRRTFLYCFALWTNLTQDRLSSNSLDSST